jgi:hypothetical protein
MIPGDNLSLKRLPCLSSSSIVPRKRKSMDKDRYLIGVIADTHGLMRPEALEAWVGYTGKPFTPLTDLPIPPIIYIPWKIIEISQQKNPVREQEGYEEYYS